MIHAVCFIFSITCSWNAKIVVAKFITMKIVCPAESEEISNTD